jgi:hypothetical protein
MGETFRLVCALTVQRRRNAMKVPKKLRDDLSGDEIIRRNQDNDVKSVENDQRQLQASTSAPPLPESVNAGASHGLVDIAARKKGAPRDAGHD